jgi:hypothetical protein
MFTLVITSRVLCQTTQENPPGPGRDFPVFSLLCLAYIARRVAIVIFRDRRARKGGAANMIKLNIPRAVATASPVPLSLCASCAFAHIVRGYLAGEEIIVCGYAFPPRDILFAVRECTDYKPKRERSGVEIATEDAVCSPPLELWAANFRVAVAARNGGRA